MNTEKPQYRWNVNVPEYARKLARIQAAIDGVEIGTLVTKAIEHYCKTASEAAQGRRKE